jgi:hypothetical protein
LRRDGGTGSAPLWPEGGGGAEPLAPPVAWGRGGGMEERAGFGEESAGVGVADRLRGFGGGFKRRVMLGDSSGSYSSVKKSVRSGVSGASSGILGGVSLEWFPLTGSRFLVMGPSPELGPNVLAPALA